MSRGFLGIGRLAAAGLAVLIVAGLAWFFWPRDPYALPASDWRTFKARFVSPEGRVIDDGNGGISHSEGQGYGMLLAVAFRDRRTFDRLWEWTEKNLRRKQDGLFSWKWVPDDGGKVADPNNATDGDILIAWALLRAFREWEDYRYQSAAAQIVIAFFEKATVDTDLGLQILPGLEGFRPAEGQVVVNPSYAVLPALSELATAFPSDKWAALRAGSLRLLETACFSEYRLAPDWALVAPSWVDLAPGHDPVFGYNAIRVPLHLAWDDPKAAPLQPYAKFWTELPADKPVPATVELPAGTFGPHPALPGMMAIRQLVLACANQNRITVKDIPPLTTEEVYYSAGLKMLTKVAIRDRFAPKRN